MTETISITQDYSENDAAAWFAEAAGDYHWNGHSIPLSLDTVYTAGSGGVLSLHPEGRIKGAIVFFGRNRLPAQTLSDFNGLLLPQLSSLFRAMEFCPGNLMIESGRERFRAILSKSLSMCRSAALAKSRPDGKRIRQRDQEQIQMLTVYLRAHIREGVHLPEMEQMTGFGMSKLKYVFRAVTGMTIRDYQNQIKVEKAEALLTQSALTSAEISEELGFSDPSGFSRFFASQTGITPMAFRAHAQARSSILSKQK